MDIKTRTEDNFLRYAGAVIKSRAISNVEDNLKPVQKKILYAMNELKLWPDKPVTKCAKVVGQVIAVYSPHGDMATYGALVHMSQPWKMRYPLIQFSGNNGNILGDGPAAYRYTNCKLSHAGELMLEDVNKHCVPFKQNYDETTEEPKILPSKFPNILCNGNDGIAVGLSAGILPHNFNEIADGLIALLEGRDPFEYIKGPDFPTGAIITNAEEIPDIYRTGRGVIKLQAHYNLTTQGKNTIITFTDIPYNVTVENGILSPLKKLVNEDGCTLFEDFMDNCTADKGIEIVVKLAKNVNVNQALDVLFTKTNLRKSIKVNNTVIVDGEPKLCSMEDLMWHYINHRRQVIAAIARTDWEKTNHQLTVVIGLQKCLTNIDLLVKIVREADNRADAKQKLIAAFEINEEQADAVLDMKISQLNRLDIVELNDKEKRLEQEVARLKDLMENVKTQDATIKAQLNEMRSYFGDARRSELAINQNSDKVDLSTLTEKEWIIHNSEIDNIPSADMKTVVFARNNRDMVLFNNAGEFVCGNSLHKLTGEIIGGCRIIDKQYFVSLSKNGLIKKIAVADFDINKVNKIARIKDGDELAHIFAVNDDDFIMILTAEDNVLKLAVKDIATSGKTAQGNKTTNAEILAAISAGANSNIAMITSENKGKITSVNDFTINARGAKGNTVTPKTSVILNLDNRATLYMITDKNKIIELPIDKMSVKGKTAMGASLSTRSIKHYF